MYFPFQLYEDADYVIEDNTKTISRIETLISEKLYPILFYCFSDYRRIR